MRGTIAFVACAALSGCTGELGAPPPGEEDPGKTGPDDKENELPTVEECAEVQEILVGLTPLRRMTRLQYNNTVRDLFGIENDPAEALSPDEKVGPFVSNSRTPITDLLVEQHLEVAVSLAAQLAPTRNEIVGCDLSSGATCVQSFVDTLGKRIYRRPLEDSERQNYLALFSRGQEESVEAGFRLVLETMLQSPFFLYHVDVGVSAVPRDGAERLTGYELANRLSYFLWNTMPDDELFALAEAGTLDEDSVLAAQVARMIEDEKAADTIPGFHTQWLRVGDMSGVEKDATLFPAYGPDLRDAMVAELGGFADHVIRAGDGLMSSLFLSTVSPMQAPLFSVYGMAQPAGFVPGQLVNLDGTERAGILTRAGFLTAQAHRDQTSPVHRGLVVRENLLCQLLEAPPAAVNNVPPSPTPATTTRERFAAHNEDPSCGNCHRLMDPIGLGFENYDPVGAYRTHDGASVVDATGELLEVASDVSGEFDGALELSEKLAKSQDVADCMASQWFRYALGRVESRDDGCAMVMIRKGFTDSGHNIRTLLTQIVLSDAFRTVRLEGAQEQN